MAKGAKMQLALPQYSKLFKTNANLIYDFVKYTSSQYYFVFIGKWLSDAMLQYIFDATFE